MILLFQFLGDFGQNGSEMFRNRSGMVPEWSQTLLGHFWLKPLKKRQTRKTNMKRPDVRKPCFRRKHKNEKDAHRNFAYNDVPDSSPSFILTPFVTKT